MSIDRLNANGGPGLRLGPVLSRVGCNIYREMVSAVSCLGLSLTCTHCEAALLSKWSEDVTLLCCAVSVRPSVCLTGQAPAVPDSEHVIVVSDDDDDDGSSAIISLYRPRGCWITHRT